MGGGGENRENTLVMGVGGKANRHKSENYKVAVPDEGDQVPDGLVPLLPGLVPDFLVLLLHLAAHPPVLRLPDQKANRIINMLPDIP
jgi:hypothetical protein